MPDQNKPKVAIGSDGTIHVDNGNDQPLPKNPKPVASPKSQQPKNPAGVAPSAAPVSTSADAQAATTDDGADGFGCGCLFLVLMIVGLTALFTLGSGLPLPLSLIAACFLAFVASCVFGGFAGK